MLEYLKLNNVGPASEMEAHMASRLNLITGDNGLGKSFLLDVAWWALTRRWPRDVNDGLSSGYAARPTDPTKSASVTLQVKGKTGSLPPYESSYVHSEQLWRGKQGRPWNSGLVIYALADGGFAVWDPHRNYWKRSSEANADELEIPDRVPAYVFTSSQVWDGLDVPIAGKATRVCNGLLSDWASWIRERGSDAKRMADVLALLGPSLGPAPLEPGHKFARLSVNDVRDIPTVRVLDQDVPILYASLGVRRITALAYMLSWAWREHVIAAEQLGDEPSSRVVLLFDEIEAHLHPRWQRAIVPALLKVMQTLTGDDSASVQLIAATHSPLVLASVEPFFDTSLDKLFTLALNERGTVALHEQPWAKQGDVINWLVSESFGLLQARSLEAERAVEAAEAWMRNDFGRLQPGLDSHPAIHAELVRVLAGHDPFWPRWIVNAQSVERTL